MCIRYLLKTLQDPHTYKGFECNNVNRNSANPGFGTKKKYDVIVLSTLVVISFSISSKNGTFCVDSSIYYE